MIVSCAKDFELPKYPTLPGWQICHNIYGYIYFTHSLEYERFLPWVLVRK